jgi:hypothetical protein
MTITKFRDIFSSEIQEINKRRLANGRQKSGLEIEEEKRDGTQVLRPTVTSNVVGLSLSGGGIRSSAFCLGVLQALDVRGLIDKVDYLSSVSGGGYIGASMTGAMSTGMAGKFPFPSELQAVEVSGVQHIRDHSNYLFPQGLLNIFGNIVVYLRGLAASVLLLLPYLLFAAAITIWSHPTVESLPHANIGSYSPYLPVAAAAAPSRQKLLGRHMKKLHASLPKHRPSTMKFLSKHFGVKPRSTGAIKKSASVTRTSTRGRRP